MWKMARSFHLLERFFYREAGRYMRKQNREKFNYDK